MFKVQNQSTAVQASGTTLLFPNGQQIQMLAQNSRWTEIPLLRELRALLPTFGSSTADSTVSRTETGTTFYFDTVRGLDTNTGLSASSPKKTVPQFIGNAQNNSKLMIAAGSTIALSNVALTPVNTRCTITCYDGDPSSSKFGQEIKDQPNPFIRGLLGGWITDSEGSSKYFTINPGWDGLSLGSSSLTTGAALNSGSCPNLLIRGAIFTGCITGIILSGGNTAYARVEDCWFKSCKTDPTTNTNNFGGAGIRVNGSTDVAPTLSLARCFIEGVGEDCIWSWYTSAITGTLTCSDFAIRHTADQQKYNTQHCDVFQLNAYPGAVTIRRGIIQHSTKTAPLLSSTADTTSIGGCFVSTNTTGNTSGTGGLVEDCIIVSNNQIANIERQSGFTFRRCIGVMSENNPNLPLGITSAALLTAQYSATITEDNCVWAVHRDASQPTSIRASINGAVSNTQIGTVVDVPNFNF